MTSARRTVRLASGFLALAVGLAATTLQAVAVIGEATSAAASVGVHLDDDDGGEAMFSASGLAGGQVVARCIAVSHESDEPSVLHLYATAAGGLAGFLGLTIEEGSGGRFGSCDGFAGRMVYAGTLAQFAAAHGAAETGLTLGVARPSDTVAYRFTVTVGSDRAAQAEEATASLWWSGEPYVASEPPAEPPGAGSSTPPDDLASPTSPVATPSSLPADPDVAAPADSSPAATATQTPTTAATPAPTARRATLTTAPPTEDDATSVPGAPSPATPLRSSSPREDGGRERPSVVLRPVDHGQPTALERLTKMTIAVAERSAFPITLLVLAMVFLVVQDGIDRRDPKLALAPIYAESDLPFDAGTT